MAYKQLGQLEKYAVSIGIALIGDRDLFQCRVIILIVLLMSESSGKVHKKNEGNHDGCNDCIRQKKENEAFIKIYERLQDVEKRTSQVRQAVSQHKTNSDTNRSFYRNYEQRVLNLPKMKDREVSTQSMHTAGYEIAALLLEKEAKGKLIAENQKLKQMLQKMQKEKYDADSHRNSRLQSRQTYNQSYQRMRDSLSQSFNSEVNSYDSLYMQREDHFQKEEGRRSEAEKLTNSQETNDSCQENGSTQSSSFTMSKMRNSMDLSKYNDLNLWLYQNQKNSKLEEQLYIVKEVKPRSLISKRTGSVLPSIKK